MKKQGANYNIRKQVTAKPINKRTVQDLLRKKMQQMGQEKTVLVGINI